MAQHLIEEPGPALPTAGLMSTCQMTDERSSSIAVMYGQNGSS